jgi:hypothetical protein
VSDSTRTSELEAARHPVADALARIGVRRFSAVEFLVVLTLWLVSTSLVMEIPGGDILETCLATVVLISAVVAVGGRRRTLAVAIVLAAPTFAGKWLNHLRPDLMPREVYTLGLMAFMIFLVGQHLRFVLRAPRVNLQVLCAGISIYLMLAVLWGSAYMLVAEFIPGAFVFTVASDTHRSMAGFQAAYFSLSTLGGFAYGDIIPVSNGARTLAMMEATTGTLYMAVLIARLVSLYSSENATDNRRDAATR